MHNNFFPRIISCENSIQSKSLTIYHSRNINLPRKKRERKVMERKIHFANTCFLIPFKLQHLFLNDKRGKNVTTKFSKIAKLVGEKMGESCRSRRATVGLLPISGKSLVPRHLFSHVPRISYGRSSRSFLGI